jgi:hypothetical protein
MSSGTTRAPVLPFAPIEYDHKYLDALNNILRLYFQQIDNPGPMAGSTLRPSATEVIAGLNFSTINQLTGQRIISFPTQVDEAAGKLRVGDVYYDTSAGNVLKIKV